MSTTMKMNTSTALGFVLMALGVIVSISRTDAGTEGLAAFAAAAAPFVLVGLGAALACAGAFGHTGQR